MLLEKTNKTALKFLLCSFTAFMLAACQQQPNTPGNNTSSQNKQQNATTTLTDADKELLDKLNSTCNPNTIEPCMQAASLLYSRGFYTDAAYAYEQICVSLQHVPACLKLADMLNQGIGVEKNVKAAKKIWETACYNGDKESCSKFK